MPPPEGPELRESEARVKGVRDTLSDLMMIAMVVCTITITVVIVRREVLGPDTSTSPPPPVTVSDWPEIADVGHRIGPEDAAVTLVTFSDFECPTCAYLAREELPRLREKYPGSIALVYRHWPLSRHRFAYPAARAVECAAQQDRFEAFHDIIFAQQDSLGLKTFAEMASEAHIPDLTLFEVCMRNTEPVPSIEADIAKAIELGATGTPTLVVNGLLLRGAIRSELLDSIADAARMP